MCNVYSVFQTKQFLQLMEKYLADDEKIQYSTFIHWKVYLLPILFALAWYYLDSDILDPFTRGTAIMKLEEAPKLIKLMLLCVASILFAKALYCRNAVEFFVTNKRILTKRGFIALSTKGMPLSHIESIDVDQTFLGRIFNYGNITIHGTGTSTILLTGIDKPFKLRKKLISNMNTGNTNTHSHNHLYS